MSFSSPTGGGVAASPVHASFGDHLLSAVGTLSPTLGGLLGVAGVHPSTQPSKTASDIQPVIPYNPQEMSAYNNAPLADYSAVGQSNAKPQGGSMLGPFLSALMG